MFQGECDIELERCVNETNPKTNDLEQQSNGSCMNSTLFISLLNDGTQFRIETLLKEQLLFVNYSSPGHEEIFNLLDRVFSYLFRGDDIIVGRSSTCDIEIIKNVYNDTEVISAVHEGESLLKLGEKHNSSYLKHEERKCASIVDVRVDVSEDIDVNRKDKYNFTALHWAAFFNQYDLAKKLIEKGANVNVLGPMNVTSLKAAVATGDLNLVRLLIEHGADVNSASYNGMVPIIVAINTGRLNIVRFLIEKGANLSASYSALGSTPLHIAAQVGNAKITKELIEHGVDMYSRDRDGSTALHLAARHANSEVVKYFIGLGMDVDVRDNIDRTPLIRATDNSLNWEEAFATIELLISSGADVKARDRNGQSPLSVLSVAGNEKIDQLLRDRGL